MEDLTSETWCTIPGYQRDYIVSPSGEIASYKNELRPRMLKPREAHDGYLYVNLWKCNEGRNFAVHRLVAASYITSWIEGYEVNHKNGNKKDNRLENLEVVTRSENLKHSYDIGLRDISGENHPQAKLTEKEVKAARRMMEDGVSTSKVAEYFDVSKSTMQCIRERRTWKKI